MAVVVEDGSDGELIGLSFIDGNLFALLFHFHKAERATTNARAETTVMAKCPLLNFEVMLVGAVEFIEIGVFVTMEEGATSRGGINAGQEE